MKIYMKTLEPIIDDMTMVNIIWDVPDGVGNYSCFDGFKKDIPADLWNRYVESIDSCGLSLRIILRRNRRMQ